MCVLYGLSKCEIHASVVLGNCIFLSVLIIFEVFVFVNAFSKSRKMSAKLLCVRWFTVLMSV